MSAAPFDLVAWFERRTFGAQDFDVDALAERKETLGTSVSVVLPALDVASTVAAVVDAVMRLAGTLVDEVVVLDGGSRDDTPRVAAARGARVHRDDHIFPELGPSLGKGDALWRGLAVTSGDVVVYLDTDVQNPGARFVSALLGPLLHHPDVHLVKGFYERPLSVGGVLQASGGGRVTELCARPLLNLYWPQLAGLIQPLAGEYAARRELLEEIPFPSGYGVELAMLIDTLALHGPDAIAQTDLGTRIHRNQDLDALSRMAFGVLQTAAERLRGEGRAPAQRVTGYWQFTRHGDEVVPSNRWDVEMVERPPLQGRRAGQIC